MQTTKFTDVAGREWDLRLSVPAMHRAEEETGVRLGSDFRNVGKLIDDPEALVNALCAIARPQLERAGVSDADFGESLDGPSINAAVEALTEACFQFLPAKRAKLLRAAFDKITSVQDSVLDELLRQVEWLDGEALLRSALPAPAGA